MKVIVIGAGSIGQRHAMNLKTLDVDVSIFDIDTTLLDKVCSQTKGGAVYDLDNALTNSGFDAAIICTPNHLHIPYAQQVINAGLNVFVEKPLSHNREGIDILLRDLKQKGLVGMAGFMLRYEPGLQYIKSILPSHSVAFAQIESGSYLPSWRPETDYRKSYSANHSMGGGIILDDTHELDYACWFFGYPKHARSSYGIFGDLDIDVEDVASFHLSYPDKLVTIHSDYLQRKPYRRCKICMKDGNSVEWVFGQSVTEYTDGIVTNCFKYGDVFSVNDMYVSEMKEFLECVSSHTQPESSLENAATILDIALNLKGE